MQRRRLLIALAALAPAVAASGATWASAPPADKKKANGSYLALNTLTATVNRTGGRRGVMTVDIGLDIKDDKLRERAELSSPRLRAGYIQSLAIYAAGLPTARAPDADFIGGMLQRQTDAMLGKPGAKLLLGAILIN